ncbi:sigma 54-interacting transcriptional regulator [Deltaproteobacteria bacterium OttesenSCG-928-M10]|nr:sigma 54-interacting transcriptional regulator [Deltaproteobacteria bacterium OttesenSCG-928-M10]
MSSLLYNHLIQSNSESYHHLMDSEKKIWLAREQFQKGRPVDPDLVRPVILESWRRSYEYGLPFDKATKTVIPPEEVQRRVAERQDLCNVAWPVMEELHDFTTGSGFILTLTDEEGYVLKILGDDEIASWAAEENNMVEGCNRCERQVGTNGIGTALAIGKPIQVFAGEHYYPLSAKWICSGAPIFDSQGRTIAVFCLTGLRDMVSFHTLGLAVATAAAVSRQLAMQQALSTVRRMRNQMKEIVEAVPSGIMMLNREMDILQINNKAAKLLALPPADIIGRKFQDIFGADSLDPGLLSEEIDERIVTVDRGLGRQNFSLAARPAGNGEAVITFERMEVQHRRVNRVIGSTAHFTFDDIIGRSPAIQNAITLGKMASENNSKVLLYGESGTGKEMFAQAIHNAGPRRDGPFIAVNCGALPKSLIESELFGYERGAFTGASSSGYAGKFELAEGGTIFLDEIGDMPFDVQVTLLRVLQNKEVCRLGSTRPIKINVRIIAATNRNLLEAIADNTFRKDLYYRLNVFNILIPALWERSGDIRCLADYFLAKYAQVAGKDLQGFSDEAYAMLEKHEWRGNVRELENVVEQAIYVAAGNIIDTGCLGRLALTDSLAPAPDHAPPADGAAAAPEPAAVFPPHPKDDRGMVEKALLATSGNVQKAAALLGISRRTIYRKMELFAIDCEAIRRRPN